MLLKPQKNNTYLNRNLPLIPANRIIGLIRILEQLARGEKRTSGLLRTSSYFCCHNKTKMFHNWKTAKENSPTTEHLCSTSGKDLTVFWLRIEVLAGDAHATQGLQGSRGTSLVIDQHCTRLDDYRGSPSKGRITMWVSDFIGTGVSFF